MSRGAPWRGFDYLAGCEVTKERAEWRALIERAADARRIKGCPDLLLFGEDGRITHEVYDKSP